MECFKCGFYGKPKKVVKRRGKSLTKFMELYDKQNGLCALCKKKFQPSDMNRDHIIPKSKGGGGGFKNIQLTCFPCNHKKGNKIL